MSIQHVLCFSMLLLLLAAPTLAQREAVVPVLPPTQMVTILRNVSNPNIPITPTARELRQRFEASDFVFDLLNSPSESPEGLGGDIRPMSVNQLPSLEGQNVAYTLFTIEPCGINLPHVHPRATEFIYIIRGDNVQTAFVGENGETPVVNQIGSGDATFFPQDLIHYQQNMGCGPVVFISALNSEDPGVVTISTQLFMAPDEGLSATLDAGMDRILQLRNALPQGPAAGQQQCMQQCGLLSSTGSSSDANSLSGSGSVQFIMALALAISTFLL